MHLGSDPDRSGSLALGLPSLRMVYAMLCYAILPHECLLGRSAVGLLRLPWAMHLEHFPFGRARFLYSIGFLGDLLWDNPFSGQGQDLIFL